MKRFYKLALALAIAVGSFSAFAVGTTIKTTAAATNENAVVIYVVGNSINVTGAEGKVITVTDLGGRTRTGIVTNGTFETSLKGIAIVQVAGTSETVYIAE